MATLKQNIETLAQLMTEFGVSEGKLSGEGWSVEFAKQAHRPVVAVTSVPNGNSSEPQAAPAAPRPAAPAAPKAPVGTPITTPMMGIFYGSSSPDSPPFVKEGEMVTAGQVIGLVEAMKVFNEITSSVTGKVVSIVAENGALVQPGETLVIIG